MPFSQQSLDFLFENRLQNSKVWFGEHRDVYVESVLQPMQDLVRSLTPTMLAIDSQFITEPKVDKTISRIYRDTRYTKDKSIYRENCWLTFMRDKKEYMGYPGFWFDINPVGFGYGMGYYQTSREAMASIRKQVLDDTQTFNQAWLAYKEQTVFRLEGDMYKKTRFPEQTEELRDLLDRKTVSFNTFCADLDLLFSDRLSDCIAEGFALLVPMYRFLCEAEERIT